MVPTASIGASTNAGSVAGSFHKLKSQPFTPGDGCLPSYETQFRGIVSHGRGIQDTMCQQTSVNEDHREVAEFIQLDQGEDVNPARPKQRE